MNLNIYARMRMPVWVMAVIPGTMVTMLYIITMLHTACAKQYSDDDK